MTTPLDGPEDNVPWVSTAEEADAVVTEVKGALLTAPASQESAKIVTALPST